MKAAVLTLADAYDTIVLRPEVATGSDPVICKQWDLGAPEVRASTSPRPGADGNYDSTFLTGPRTVVFELALMGDDPYTMVERLVAMAHPSRRPVLKIKRGNAGATGETWEMQLRGNPFSISYGRRAAALLELQLSFEAPLGYLVSPWRETSSGVATGTASQGFVFPAVFPLSTGHGSSFNPIATQRIGGSAPVAPVITIYGPATNPQISDTTGGTFTFAGLTLSSGQFVRIDMGAGTVRLNGATNASLYHLIDWSKSTFWTWMPGTTPTVRYVANSGQISVQWRERRLTV